MKISSTVLITTAVTAAIGAVVTVYLSSKLQDSSKGQADGPQQPNFSGSAWTNAGAPAALGMEPETAVYEGPGNQQPNTSLNGQIYTKRFASGGNANAGGTNGVERSGAFQTATKNPFANGTNTTYADAVNRATRDPTNAATALVLGPGIAPND